MAQSCLKPKVAALQFAALKLLALKATRLEVAARQSFGALLLSMLAAAAQTAAAQTPPVLAPAPVSQASAAAASGVTPGNPEDTVETLPMVVGRSMFLNVTARLKRVYVSDPLVLDSYTADPRQIVITAKTAGASSLVLWDEDGRSHAYLVLSSIDIAALRGAVRQALPGSEVDVEAQGDTVSLSGRVSDQPSLDAALKMAAVYSKNVVNAMVLAPPHASQVRLQVKIVEIDRSRLEQFGLNFFGGPKNPSGVTTGQFPVSTSVTGSAGTTTTPGESSLTVSDPLNLFLFNNSLSVGVTIKDLESKRILQILAEPTITTLSGEKASFLSGGEFPFPVIEGGAGSLASVTIQFRPYGVKLDFTPVVNADGTILLKVAPEVSALDYTNAVTISGYTIPALSTRRAETVVELRDGQSFAISGLLDHRTTDVLSRVPVAGSLPVLGALFRSKDINHSVVELVVIVTPTIVDPLSHPTDPTAPLTPTFVIPLLDDGKFDEKLRGATKPFPAEAPARP